MKKLLAIFAFLVVVIGLTSCSLTSTDTSGPTTYTGLLVEQAPDDNYAGTHLLIDDAGQVIVPLRSLIVNLSNGEYLNNKVQVVGKLNSTDRVFEVTSVSVVDVVNKDKGKREFTEYKNATLGFRLKYYSDWKVTENSATVTFEAPSKNGTADVDKVVVVQVPFNYVMPPASAPVTGSTTASVDTTGVTPTVPVTSASDSVTPAPTPMPTTTDSAGNVIPADQTNASDPIKAALQSYADTNHYSGVEWQTIGPDKMTAIKYDKTYDTDYIFYRTGFAYTIRFSPSGIAPAPQNKAIFNEMISEFQFIPFGSGSTLSSTTTTASANTTSGATATDTSNVTPSVSPTVTAVPNSANTEIFTSGNDNMSSFQSSLYHFSAQYPAGWYYSGTKGAAADISHHYAFSNTADGTDTNELIGLDVMTDGKPAGTLASQTSGGIYTVYVTVDNQTYRISGKQIYKDIIETMAKSITPIQNSQIQ